MNSHMIQVGKHPGNRLFCVVVCIQLLGKQCMFMNLVENKHWGFYFSIFQVLFSKHISYLRQFIERCVYCVFSFSSDYHCFATPVYRILHSSCMCGHIEL